MTNTEEQNNSNYIYEDGKIFLLAQEDAVAVEILTEEGFQYNRVSDNFTLEKNGKIAVAKIDEFNKQDKLIQVGSKKDLEKILNIRYIKERDINPPSTKAVEIQDGVFLDIPDTVLKGISFDMNILFNRVQIPENAQTLEIILDIPIEMKVVEIKGNYNNINYIREDKLTVILELKDKLEPITLSLKSENTGSYDFSVLEATYSDIYGKTEINTQFYGTKTEIIDGVLGDFDNNGLINLNDFLAFSKAYGTSSTDSDFDNVYDIGPANLELNYNEALYSASPDGKIDVIDFAVFIRNFGKTLGIPLSLNLPEGFEVFPISYNPPVDNNSYFKLQIYTIDEYVEPQEYLKIELFFDDYIYNNDDKLGEFILTKDVNQDETGLTKYSAILKIPDSYSVNYFWDFYVRYVRNDGIKSVIPGELENISTFRLMSLEKAKQINQNIYNYAYIVKYWEDIMPKKQLINVTFNDALAPWVDSINVMKKIRVEYSSAWNSEKIFLDSSKIEFEHYDFFLSEQYRLNNENEITEETENEFSAPFAKKEIFDDGDTVQIKPMPKYKIKYSVSDTTSFASVSSYERTVFLGQNDWDYFINFNYEYEKFLNYAEANDDYFAVEENYNDLDYGYDFDLDGLRDIYFREYNAGLLDDAKGYVVQDDFNNIYNYDQNKENSYASINNDYFDTHVFLFNTGEKYIKLQVIGETTIDATFVKNVINWGDSQ
jgi:hypothetical protein